jgi:hypothetical protein
MNGQQGGVVTFNYTVWLAEYSEFGYVTQPQAQSFFNRACLLVDNTPSSQIQDLFARAVLLNMATAHFAKMFSAPSGQSVPGLVGRISNATEGSVSVQAEYTTPTSDLQAFWNQTEYGAAYWAATLKYRTGFYVPPPISSNGNQRVGAFGFGRFGFLR